METSVSSAREPSAPVDVHLPLLVDVTTYAQQRQLPLEEMGNALLDAMQGTLICLDSHHVIVDVSKTITRHFGFEQVCGSSSRAHVPRRLLLDGNHRAFNLVTH